MVEVDMVVCAVGREMPPAHRAIEVMELHPSFLSKEQHPVTLKEAGCLVWMISYCRGGEPRFYSLAGGT